MKENILVERIWSSCGAKFKRIGEEGWRTSREITEQNDIAFVALADSIDL